jgi:Stigma-specific protein, Stig1
VSQQSTSRSLDELAKGLATGHLSRGKALRWMGGALLGAALASFPGVAWANDDDDRCPEGQSRCGERCVNLRFNERHCGRCFNRCRSTQSCCNGRCVNLKRNENHCGSCFNRCGEGEECVRGVCEGTCPGTETAGDCTCAITCEGGSVSQFRCQEEVNPNCVCTLTIEEEGFCADQGPLLGECPPAAECSSSDDCAAANPGSKCIINTCCGFPVCAPPCTPTCAQNDSACSTSSDCCSGNCSNGTCCPPGSVEVGNGACARSGGNSGCAGTGNNCTAAGCQGCVAEAGGGGTSYCRGSAALSPCTSHADCGPGQFCGTSNPFGTGQGACYVGC